MHKIKRRKQKNKKILITLSVFLFAIVLILPAYAYMQQQLGVEGNTLILDTQEDKKCDGNVTYEITSWSNNNLNYYKLSFNINNNSANDYNYWDVYFDIPDDAELFTYSSTEAERIGNKIKASNAIYNGNIKSGESISFEIQITTLEANYVPTSITLNNCTSNTEDNKTEQLGNIDVEFKVVGSYGNYTYQYDVNVINNSTNRIDGWYFKIKKPANTNLINAWNANYIIKEEEIEFSNADYNNIIEPGQSVTFGIIIETDIYGYIPDIIRE